MDYSIVANSCISWVIYKQYNPTIHEMFINYTTPFISSWFPNDNEYLKLCENYEYYISLEPRFGPPISSEWEKNTMNKRHTNPQWGEYVVMFLDDVEIHWIHDFKPSLVLKKFKGRLKNNSENELLFLWSDLAMFNKHTEDERKILINRFNAINHKTIFLTKHKEEEYVDNMTVVKFVPKWENMSDSIRTDGFLTWSTMPEFFDLYKDIINKI